MKAVSFAAQAFDQAFQADFKENYLVNLDVVPPLSQEEMEALPESARPANMAGCVSSLGMQVLHIVARQRVSGGAVWEVSCPHCSGITASRELSLRGERAIPCPHCKEIMKPAGEVLSPKEGVEAAPAHKRLTLVPKVQPQAAVETEIEQVPEEEYLMLQQENVQLRQTNEGSAKEIAAVTKELADQAQMLADLRLQLIACAAKRHAKPQAGPVYQSTFGTIEHEMFMATYFRKTEDEAPQRVTLSGSDRAELLKQVSDDADLLLAPGCAVSVCRVGYAVQPVKPELSFA